MKRQKSAAAVAMGKLRMAKLTPEERSKLAHKAALARWPIPPPKDPGGNASGSA